MTDVHEAYVERRRWRIWPIVLLVLVALFGIAVLVAMIMNIHGSITWPAGEVRFGFWPKRDDDERGRRLKSRRRPAGSRRKFR